MVLAWMQNIGFFEMLCIGFVVFLFFAASAITVILVVLRGTRRKCPRCGESIAVEARVCRFCGADVANG
jgi:hypothetical protein